MMQDLLVKVRRHLGVLVYRCGEADSLVGLYTAQVCVVALWLFDVYVLCSRYLAGAPFISCWQTAGS